VTRAAYEAIDAWNFSRIKHLRESPLRFHHRKDHHEDDSDALRLGRATHTAVFEPDRFPLEYIVWTGDRRAGKEWEAFRGAGGGRTILTESQYGRALGIRDAVRAHPLASVYLRRGEPEKTLTWTDDATGLACKARLDWLAGDLPCVVDLKTARTIEASAFGRSAARLGYHNQLAFYSAGAVANELLIEPRALIIAVEQEPPHEVAIFRLDGNALACGAEENAALLAKLKTCIDTNAWPGRYETEQDLALPHWLFGDDEEDPEDMGFRRATGE
jgi:hypothetical protein